MLTAIQPAVTPTVSAFPTDIPEYGLEPTMNPTIRALMLTPWPTRGTLDQGPTLTFVPTSTEKVQARTGHPTPWWPTPIGSGAVPMIDIISDIAGTPQLGGTLLVSSTISIPRASLLIELAGIGHEIPIVLDIFVPTGIEVDPDHFTEAICEVCGVVGGGSRHYRWSYQMAADNTLSIQTMFIVNALHHGRQPVIVTATGTDNTDVSNVTRFLIDVESQGGSIEKEY